MILMRFKPSVLVFTSFVATFLVVFGLTGCSTVNPHYNPAKPHHRPDGFQNNYTTATDKSRSELIRWTWEARKAGLPKPPQTPTPEVKADLAFVRANIGAKQVPAATWIGHATMLVQMGGLNFITDPHLTERASPVSFAGPKRAQPPGISLADLPRIDVVLLSHNHYDHLDEKTVSVLNKQAGGAPLFVVPLGVKAWMADVGITNVRELDWWDSFTVPSANGTAPLEIHFTPVQHWSARGIGDRRATLWGGFAVFASDFHVYFSGDTGYSKDFLDTQAKFAARQTPALGGGFDLALIAVGAYEPRWFMKEQHVNPEEAVQIYQDLRAKTAVGVHWGSFNLTDESLDQPPKDLAAARSAKGLAEAAFGVMAIGETRRYPKRPAP